MLCRHLVEIRNQLLASSLRPKRGGDRGQPAHRLEALLKVCLSRAVSGQIRLRLSSVHLGWAALGWSSAGIRTILLLDAIPSHKRFHPAQHSLPSLRSSSIRILMGARASSPCAAFDVRPHAEHSKLQAHTKLAPQATIRRMPHRWGIRPDAPPPRRQHSRKDVLISLHRTFCAHPKSCPTSSRAHINTRFAVRPRGGLLERPEKTQRALKSEALYARPSTLPSMLCAKYPPPARGRFPLPPDYPRPCSHACAQCERST